MGKWQVGVFLSSLRISDPVQAVRKAKERAEKERRAEENRIRHGRTKAERAAEDAQRIQGRKKH